MVFLKERPIWVDPPNDWDDKCPACEHPGFADKPCKNCGYGGARSPLRSSDTLEGGKYIIRRVLGKPGGFGITYLAWHQDLGGLRAIKEYLPDDVATREDESIHLIDSKRKRKLFDDGRKEFLREARTLKALASPEPHPNVLSVLDFFEENKTAYIVMPYYEGQTLSEYLKDLGGPMNEPEAIQLMIRVLDGLKHVHKSRVVHLDIKPSNIYLQCKGPLGSIKAANPILIDFGAARFEVDQQSRYVYGTPSQRDRPVFTPGYAPPTQYELNASHNIDVGPWSDTYACMATVYRMVAGQKPPGAQKQAQPTKWPKEISSGLGKILAQGMAEHLGDRYQDAQALQEALNALLKKRQLQKRRWKQMALLFLIVVLAAVMVQIPAIQTFLVSQPSPVEDLVENSLDQPSPMETLEEAPLDSVGSERPPPDNVAVPDSGLQITKLPVTDPGEVAGVVIPEGIFADTLKTARSFYNIGLWKSAAEKFIKAVEYIDLTKVDRKIRSKLVAAKSHYKQGGYQEAAEQFYTAFKELYPN